MSGVKPKELEYPDRPAIFARIWRVFCDLSADTSWQSIYAYNELMQANLTPDDIKLIRDIDYVRNAALNKQPLQKVLEVFNYG